MSTRSFRVVVGSETAVRTYAPEHSPSAVEAPEVLPLLEPEVGKALSACSAAARDYLVEDVLKEGTPLDSILVSVEEV